MKVRGLLIRVNKMLEEEKKWDWIRKMVGTMGTIGVVSFLYYIWPSPIPAPQCIAYPHKPLFPPLPDLGLNNVWSWLKLVSIAILVALILGPLLLVFIRTLVYHLVTSIGRLISKWFEMNTSWLG
jgi:hypothetical protein